MNASTGHIDGGAGRAQFERHAATCTAACASNQRDEFSQLCHVVFALTRSILAYQGKVRDASAKSQMDHLVRDIRNGLRLLRHAPIFTAVPIVSLGLGIGANAAIFQLFDTVRLRSLPVAQPHELVEVRVEGCKVLLPPTVVGAWGVRGHPAGG
jgi:hypothetical protein